MPARTGPFSLIMMQTPTQGGGSFVSGHHRGAGRGGPDRGPGRGPSAASALGRLEQPVLSEGPLHPPHWR